MWIVFFGNREPAAQTPVLSHQAEEPSSGAVVVTPWTEPSAIFVGPDTVYILDTGNNRILETDGNGTVNGILCETDECAFTLDEPEDLFVVGTTLYVANTGAGTIEVIGASGERLATYELPTVSGQPPRPTGIFVAEDGSMYASDWNSGRVAIFGPDGEFLRHFGEDTVGVLEFDQPAGLELDSSDNIYVAEYGTGRIQKISPAGRHLATFWMIPGGTNVSESTDVAIADNGLVFMADNKRSVVHVFSDSARYLGIVGLVDASRRDSPGALLRPYGLAVDGDRLHIIDRVRGQLTYTIDPEYFLQDRIS